MPRPAMRLALILAAVSAATILTVGCGRSGSEADGLKECCDSADSSVLVRETWDIYRLQGHRVGYAHTTVRRKTVDGRETLAVEGLSRFSISRSGNVAEVAATFRETQSPDGRLLDFESEMQLGGLPIQSKGTVRDGKLHIEMTSKGQQQKAAIAWPANAGGMLAHQESLMRQPMKAGERRTVSELTPSNELAEIDMAAREEEEVELLGGKFRLLRIDVLTRMPRGRTIKGVAWVNSRGETLKEWTDALDMEAIRATKEVALAETEPLKLDLNLQTLVRLDRRLPNAHQTRKVRYRLTLTGKDPLEVFPNGSTQQVKRIDDRTAEATVVAAGPDRPGFSAAADPPTDADRQPNMFIQSDDSQIVADAREASAGQTDPARVAVALEEFVHKAITKKDYSQAFDTAARVARTRAGDCTEHAVYLAALARARGIPARCVIGLVCVPNAKSGQYDAFGGHMWTEVYLGNRWVPLDGTLGQGGIGGGHLKIAHTSMDGVAAYGSLLPVIDVLGRLKIEVLEAE